MNKLKFVVFCLLTLLTLNTFALTAQSTDSVKAVQTAKDSTQKRWSMDADGNLVFTVTSDGTTGPEWIARLETKCFRLGDWTKFILLSKDFKPTSGILYRLVAIKGTAFEEFELTNKNIRARAKKTKWQTPNAEVACLLRENFSDEELKAMGVWYLVAMHEPIDDSVGLPLLLNASRFGGASWLNASCAEPDDEWRGNGAFVFVLSASGVLGN